MATVNVALQQIVRGAGLAPSFAAATAADTYKIPNDGHVWLEVKNTGGSPVTVTVATPGSVDGLAIADLAVTVPATTGDRIIGPFPPVTYNDPADNTLSVTVSGACTLAAFHL